MIFTAKDDNSVGDAISGSTGSPSGYYATYAMNLVGGNATLSNLRIAYAWTGIEISGGDNLTLYNAQIVNCQNGIYWLYSGGSAMVRNALFANILNDLDLLDLVTTNTVSAQNVTFVTNSSLIVPSSFSAYFSPYSPIISLTNCILASVTNEGETFSGANNGSYAVTWTVPGGTTASQYPFQSVGAGNYYLTNGCGFFNAGTTNIDTTLLANLKQKTTYPPLLLTNQSVSINTTLNPQAQRDTDMPDLGYHYDPIDYLVDQFGITNATLTMANGVAVATYNDTGIVLLDGSSIVSMGSPLYPNWIVRYSSVQEQPVSIGYAPYDGLDVIPYYNSVAPNGQYRFTKFACPAGGGDHLYNFSNQNYNNLSVQDCEFLERGKPNWGRLQHRGDVQ